MSLDSNVIVGWYRSFGKNDCLMQLKVKVGILCPVQQPGLMQLKHKYQSLSTSSPQWALSSQQTGRFINKENLLQKYTAESQNLQMKRDSERKYHKRPST